MQKALPALDADNMAAVHVRLVEPSEAVSWLELKGWKAAQISHLKDAGLLDQGSYALRPFFIQQIWRYGEDAQGFSKFLSFPLNALLENMLVREASILKDSFHTRPHIDLEDALLAFYKEVAREMADAETEHVDTASLTLISDLVFQTLVSSEDLGMLRYRAPALSLLEQEMAPSQRRFPHSEIQDYFTAKSYFDLVREGEISKALRRNILGTDILETFHDVCVSSNQDEADEFRESAYKLIRQQLYDDRSRKNLPALLLASLYESEKPMRRIALSYLNLDECCLRETLPQVQLEQVMVSLLDVRGADISKIVFDKCQVGSLIADGTTRLPVGFPVPGILTLDNFGRAESVHDQRQVLCWIRDHTEQPDVGAASSEALSVLERICRAILRQNWIRETAVDDRAARLLEDEYWPRIREVLSENGLLGVRQGVAASGPRSSFIRVLRAKDLLTAEVVDPVVHRVRERVGKLG